MMDRRLLREAGAVRLPLGITVGLGLLAAVAAVLQAGLLSYLASAAFLGRERLEALALPLAALLAVIVVRACLAGAKEITANRAAGRIKGRLRRRLLERLFALGPLSLQGERTGEVTSTATEGIEALDPYFSQYLPNLALALLVPLTILAFVFPLDWPSGAVLLVTAPLIPLFMVLIGRLADHLSQQQWESLSRLSAHFLDVLQGLTTLRLLGLSKAQAQGIARASGQFADITLGVLRVAFLSALVLELLAAISTAIVAVEVGLRLLYGGLTLQPALFVLLLAPEYYLPLRSLGASFHASATAVAASRRLYPLPDDGVDGGDGQPPLPADGNRKGKTAPAGHWPAIIVPSPGRADPEGLLPAPIRFEQIGYAYDGGERPALDDVSFRIEPGQRMALVGPSGAGKSTVVSLLLRFMEPGSGRILVGDTDLRDISIERWRAHLAWVPQRPHLFPGTVAGNIRLGCPEASPDEVVAAARLAHADEFIEALPAGYETPLGEQGARLSGGQAQRIALARAFLRDAPLLLLDEPAANLDAELEAKLQEALRRLMQGRTVLFITHRLSSVDDADTIVVLEAGRVVQAGSPSALVAGDGPYRRLLMAYEGLA